MKIWELIELNKRHSFGVEHNFKIKKKTVFYISFKMQPEELKLVS